MRYSDVLIVSMKQTSLEDSSNTIDSCMNWGAQSLKLFVELKVAVEILFQSDLLLAT